MDSLDVTRKSHQEDEMIYTIEDKPKNSKKLTMNLHVIHKLCRDQDAGDEQSMNIERIDWQ